MTDFEKARDEHLEKLWLEVEPFGFDHPDTYEFIKDRMNWARDWLVSQDHHGKGFWSKAYGSKHRELRELQAKADKLAEAIEEADKYLSVSSREMIGSNSILHKKMKDALKEFRGEE